MLARPGKSNAGTERIKMAHHKDGSTEMESEFDDYTVPRLAVLNIDL